jgi:diguanylate cyclase (GGDEF)-like protein/PAS domain S-box-containing protein
VDCETVGRHGGTTHPGPADPHESPVPAEPADGAPVPVVEAAGDVRQRLLLDAISDVVMISSAAGRFGWVSPSVTAVLGWQPQELAGRSIFAFVHPDDHDRVLMRRARLLATAPDTARDAESALLCYRFRRRDGGWAWVETHGRTVPADGLGIDLDPGDARDQAAGSATTSFTLGMAVVVTMRDVSQRYRLEAEQAQSAAMFEDSFAAAPIGKALVGPDGRFLKVNEALCLLLGRSHEQLLATTFQQLTLPEDLDADEQLLAQTAAGARDGYRMEKRYLRPDGTVVWGLLAVSVVRDERGTPRFYISQIQDITDRKAALAEMERLATTDSLTGLPNRLLLMDRMRHALTLARRGRDLVGVVFIDLDGFKPVNDTLGHDAGDELLRQVGQRLAQVARESDTTTRLGGDEFVVVCEQLHTAADATAIGERIRSALDAPYTVYGHDVQVGASIGVATGRGGNAEALLREADRAMYIAKHANRGHSGRIPHGSSRGVGTSGEALEIAAHEQHVLHAELGDGIARGELAVFYQPIVNLRTGATVAREALIRWQHPTLGLLPPAAFLDSVDRTHLGIALGEHVLTRACTEAATWDDDLVVHVNISARQLAQPRFPRFVAACLRSAGLAPDRLVLEITESLVLTASPSTLTSTGALTSLGVGLSLDDFGTGYSSIAALNRIPIDSFKIDRTFIADAGHHPTSAALVEGLISLGAHLDLDVIAEGVETPEQADWLASRGCPYAQGFHFGRPVPSA